MEKNMQRITMGVYTNYIKTLKKIKKTFLPRTTLVHGFLT
jgi:hypothetical protein